MFLLWKMTAWQPNTDWNETGNKARRWLRVHKAGRLDEWMEKTGGILNKLETYEQEAKHIKETGTILLFFSHTLIGWTSASHLKHHTTRCMIRRSIVCLQVCKLDDVHLSLCPWRVHFNRAWHWDIYGANKVKSGFPDCPNQTGALSRQWAVDNP